MSTNNNNNVCIDPSRLTLAIFGAIFGTLLLCTGFALAVWYLVRNHQFADKLLFSEAEGKYNNRRKKQQQKTENELEAAEGNNGNIEEEINSKKLENNKNKIENIKEFEEKDQIMVEMNEINNNKQKLTKIVEISPKIISPREEEIYGTTEEYNKKRIIKDKKIFLENKRLNFEKKYIKEEEEIKEGKEEEEGDQMDNLNNSEINGKINEVNNAAKVSTINGNSDRTKNENSDLKQLPKNGKLIEEKLENTNSDLLNSEIKENSWKEEEIKENKEEQLIPEHLRSMLSEEQFGMLEANKRRLEQERRQLRELGVIF